VLFLYNNNFFNICKSHNTYLINIIMKLLIQLKQKDLKPLREQWHKEQNNICPILKQEFDISEMVIDHIHMTKKETIGINGAGLCRKCIHRQINSFEGKITNAYKRYGLDKFDMSLPDILRSLADYLEQQPSEFIHPNEAPKQKIVTKSSFNKLIKKMKLSGYTKKYPIYRIVNDKNKQKLTIPLKKLFNQFNIEPEFYDN